MKLSIESVNLTEKFSIEDNTFFCLDHIKALKLKFPKVKDFTVNTFFWFK